MISFKGQSHDKFAANVLFAFNNDSTVHFVRELLYDSHSQTRAVVFASDGVIFLRERLEHLLLKFLAHSHACVLDSEADCDRIIVHFGLIGGTDYFSSGTVVFHGVAHDIHKYLL